MTKYILNNLFYQIIFVEFLKRDLQNPKPSETDHYNVPW